MRKYWKYIRPYLLYFIIGPLAMIVEVLGEVIMPKLLANIVDTGIATRNIPYIAGSGVMMVVTAILMMLGGVGGAYFAAKACVGFSSDLRKDVFDKVQDMSFANLDSFSTGSLVTRLTNDITQIQNFINMLLRMMLRAPGMLIGALIMAVVINAKLAVILLVVIPVLAILLIFIMKNSFPRFGAMQEKIDALNNNVQEVLTGVRVIKSFVRGDYEEKRFAGSNEDLKQSSLRAFKLVIFMMPIMMLMMNATTLAVVWFGGRQVIAGSMEIGSLTAFITYITQILMSLMFVAFILMQTSRALASLKRVREVLDCSIDLTDEGVSMPDKEVTSGDIEFRNVSFRYYKNNHEWVLDDISFRVDSGKTLGIIGSTGSGKTTLVSMIPRLYDADEGTVLVDGTDVRDYSLKNLRAGIGMVLQKNVLFSGSIMENLMWGDEEASEEEVKKAAADAQADGFILDKEKGYDEELGQGGVNVSGGQKQRLCIARALLKKPKILILDDSTSAVDTATEARIRESFRTTLKGTTKIIIAQRISSVIEADLIMVMDDGKIAGIGSHDELIRNCPPYQEIYYSQIDKDEEVSA
ncbi:MAG: ABC transporter ATP-binding protein/permease [Lachnospiraceae bacterium]|nr:ABC transporter ATP-binding protein/permease [Lachnospiraceae bacterium]